MESVAPHNMVVNCLGAPWPEDLSPSFLDQLRGQGVGIVPPISPGTIPKDKDSTV